MNLLVQLAKTCNIGFSLVVHDYFIAFFSEIRRDAV